MFTEKLDKKLLLGLAISALCLFFLFRKIDFHKMAEAFAGLEYRYLVPALLLTFVSYYLRAVRWKFLLLPIKKTTMGNLFPSTLIGYMANNLLPARLGELVRAYSLGNKEGIGTSAVFASLVLDRLCDGFTILLVLLITFFTIRLPAGMEGIQRALVTGGYVTFALYLGVLAFLFLLRRHTELTLGLVARLVHPVAPHLGEKIDGVLRSFISGIRFPGNLGAVLGILVSSLLVWATAIWPVDLMLRAFGVVLPATASMFIMVFLVFAVMVPASPGFIGTHHLACVTALSAFQIGSERALSIAIVIHAMGFFPVTIAGLGCLWRDKLSIRTISENTSQEQLREQ
ncbi:lysylphosphatidylglycerol synthase transmembrane domain-containing protein [Geomonas azotofigens]|uniref:lysylphosphatidylglycerol synthase transmembrane domain-containing protein n=1 Tax=Geomonas azotofigens TaxID=2843196 RepID=UPI001C103070|nr:lysylphosphatidylglycerol synthase transmembrane domain-containing protein [Geomonas azotofigens]MBU5612576.1 flippase-like domain-containing protein [Geomonas azotofigens]